MRFRPVLIAILVTLIIANVIFIANAELPEPYAYFNDFADVLGEDEEQAINQELLAIKNTWGFDFVIVTVQDVGSETAKGYAVELFEAWGIGNVTQDNGLLLLNVTEGEQRSILFEVGYGLEGVFTDIYTGQILDEMIPYLSEDDYQQAYTKAIELVADKAATEWSGNVPQSDEQEDNNSPVGLLVMGLVLLYLFLLLLARVTRQWWLYDILWLILRMLFRGGGRGGFGGSGGGFGGFGGGRSGGGGSSRSY